MTTRTFTRDAAAILAGRLSRLASAIGALVLLSRMLPQASYGQFALLWTVYQSVAPLIAGGLSMSLSATLGARRGADARGPIYGTLLVLLSAGGAAGALLAFGLGRVAVGLGPSGTGAALPFGIFLPAGLAVLAGEGTFIGLGRPRLAGTVVAVQAAVRLAGLGLGASNGTAEGALWGLAVASWAALVGQLSLLLVLVGAPRARADLGGWREPLALGSVLSFSSLVGSIAQQTDRFLVAALLGTEMLAVYVNGSMENPLVPLITGSIVAGGMPALSRAFAGERTAEPAALVRGMSSAAAWLLHPVFWLTLWGAGDLIELAFTERYAAAAPILRIYALLIPLRCLPLGPVFAAARRPWIVFRFAWIFLTTNLLLSVFLIQWLGPAGAAASTVAATYGAAAVYLVGFPRVLGISLARAVPLGDWARTFVVSGVCALPLLALPAAWPPVARLLAGAALYGALCLGLRPRGPVAERGVRSAPDGTFSARPSP
jgi:O-antigen/teichoic acid export membrane protein